MGYKSLVLPKLVASIFISPLCLFNKKQTFSEIQRNAKENQGRAVKSSVQAGERLIPHPNLQAGKSKRNKKQDKFKT